MKKELLKNEKIESFQVIVEGGKRYLFVLTTEKRLYECHAFDKQDDSLSWKELKLPTKKDGKRQ